MNKIGFALPKFKILSSLFQDVPQMVTLDTMKMFFPIWYVDIVKKQERALDPLLILSLIRQESAFNKLARSGVGARGLMQVMPATARTVASVRTAKLFDPTVNIGVGTKYFSQKLHQYYGDVELTLAAYNAGFSRVDQWKKTLPRRTTGCSFSTSFHSAKRASMSRRSCATITGTFRLYNEEEATETVAGQVPLSIQKMQGHHECELRHCGNIGKRKSKSPALQPGRPATEFDFAELTPESGTLSTQPDSARKIRCARL